MHQGHDGNLYLTASQIRDRDGYHDITPALLRTWVAAGHLAVVTVADLAAALGVTPPPNTGDMPARAPGPSGPENVYRWADIVRCETARRRTGVGRPRGRRPRTLAAA